MIAQERPPPSARPADGRLPVNNLVRTTFPAGQVAACPAAYVRAPGRVVQRLEQAYRRLSEGEHGYTALVFGFTAGLSYDRAGLVLEHLGIAARSA